MEQGYEGDEILFISLRQLTPSLTGITRVGQLSSDLLYEIIVNFIIALPGSENDYQFPKTLPTNIANKHNIATKLAAKLKELGFIGDCGYNQILYPVETQSRALLNWIVRKLPKLEEDIEPEILSNKDILFKNIMTSLKQFKSQTSTFPFSTSASTFHKLSAYRTYHDTQNNNTDESKVNLFALIAVAQKYQKSVAPTVLEIHLNQLNAEKLENFQLPSSLLIPPSNSMSLATGNTSNTTTLNPSKNLAFLSHHEESEYLKGLNLKQLISYIATENDNNVANTNTNINNNQLSRFALATEFSSENNPINNYSSNGKGFLTSSTTITNQNNASSTGTTESSITSNALSDSLNQPDEEDSQRKLKEEIEEQERQQIIKDLKESVAVAEIRVTSLESSHALHLRELQQRILQLQEELAQLSGIEKGLEAELVVKGQALQLIPNAMENINKLKELVTALTVKALKLAQEWETHRVPLVDRLQALQAQLRERKKRCQEMVSDIKRFQDEIPELSNTIQQRQHQSEVLKRDLKGLPQELSRLVYTHRILDIIASIAKQDLEIAKISTDIKAIQKTINSVTSARDRADLVTEEKIFKAANALKKDPAMVEAYRLLSALRNAFLKLQEKVDQIGKLEKQSRNLNQLIDQEAARVSSNNTESILHDLQEMKSENQVLAARIQNILSTKVI